VRDEQRGPCGSRHPPPAKHFRPAHGGSAYDTSPSGRGPKARRAHRSSTAFDLLTLSSQSLPKSFLPLVVLACSLSSHSPNSVFLFHHRETNLRPSRLASARARSGSAKLANHAPSRIVSGYIGCAPVSSVVAAPRAVRWRRAVRLPGGALRLVRGRRRSASRRPPRHPRRPPFCAANLLADEQAADAGSGDTADVQWALATGTKDHDVPAERGALRRLDAPLVVTSSSRYVRLPPRRSAAASSAPGRAFVSTGRDRRLVLWTRLYRPIALTHGPARSPRSVFMCSPRFAQPSGPAMTSAVLQAASPPTVQYAGTFALLLVYAGAMLTSFRHAARDGR